MGMQCFNDLWQKQPSLKPKSVILVAAPDHAGRCVAVTKSMTQDINVVCAPRACYPNWEEHGCNAVTGYDSESTQAWTTSRNRFLAKELTIRSSQVAAGHVKAAYLP